MGRGRHTKAAALPESTRTAAKAEGMTDLAVARFARQRAGAIRHGMRDYLKTLALIKQAWDERDWEALGYDDWHSYVDGEFGAERLGLPSDQRHKAVVELRLAGMSTRAIGSALGVSHTEVGRQLRSGGTDVPPEDEIRGVDGKTYAATQTPARRDPEPTQGESAIATPGGPDRAKPPAWDPEERKAHEDEVARRRDIEAARRTAQTIVTTVRSAVVTVVTGCRYGERGLVTKQMVADLRDATDLLETEIDDER